MCACGVGLGRGRSPKKSIICRSLGSDKLIPIQQCNVKSILHYVTGNTGIKHRFISEQAAGCFAA